MVDLHSKNEYKGMRTYLTADGNAGVAIKKNGDVVSVFAKGGKDNMGKLIPFAIAHGGRKLDCYAKGLQNMYARYGAKVTGKTPFNEEYAPADKPKEQESPKYVVAMTLPKSLDEMERNYKASVNVNLNKVRTFRDDEKKYGYDKMIEHRDAISEGSNISPFGLISG